MTALDALVTVLDAGGKIVPDRERPRVLFPAGLRDLVVEHRHALRALVIAHGHCAADVFRRAQAFRQQIAEWATSNRPGVPLLVRLGNSALVSGHCISCGITIEAGWRCGVCLRAVHVALELADPESEESTAAPSARCSKHPITRRADICVSCRPIAMPEEA